MNQQFNEILNELGVIWEDGHKPGGEPWYQANITDSELELYTRCVVKLCVDKVLGCRVLHKTPSSDPDSFKQWNQAILVVAEEVYDLVSENQP